MPINRFAIGKKTGGYFFMKIFDVVRALAPFLSRDSASLSCHGQRVDRHTALPGERALEEIAEPMLERCQRRGEPLGLLVFEFEDLLDVEELYGARARRQMLGLIGRGLRQLAGGRGVAMRQTRSRFLVMLPGCSQTTALDVAKARLGRACSFELDEPEHELVLVPRVTALCATTETDSIKQLLLSAVPQADAAPCSRATKARPSAPIPAPMPTPSAAVKPKFDLPDNPRVAAFQPHLPTFPMPLSRASGR